MRICLILTALVIATASPAFADPASAPLIAPSRVADELRAIGRLRSAQATSGVCSAVLVAPDLVLTAAHCARRSPPRLMNPPMFIVGPEYEPPLFRIRVIDVMHHVAFGTQERSIDTLFSDLALLRLEAPVPADIATPLPLAQEPQSNAAAIYGYANSAGDILHGHAICQIGTIRPNLLGSDCNVTSGFSGTAVLSGPPGARRLEGIAVARMDDPRVRAIIADVVPWPAFIGAPPAPESPPSAPVETSP